MRDRLFVILQYLLPRYALTAVVYWLARVRQPAVKDFLIRRFVHHFDVDLEGVSEPVPEGFDTFNAFFIRELTQEARPIADDPAAIVSPVDGTVSAAGRIQGDTIFQAKGIDYRLEDLLEVDRERAAAFENGSFATIYLAPYNYHRIHAPVDGRLDALHYVPGDLFSVNAATVRIIRGLFRRNERLVQHLDTAIGPVAVILVGALNVGSISSPWTGEIRPRRRGAPEDLPVSGADPEVARGDLLGCFNMGSTVILLLPPGAAGLDPALVTGTIVEMGQAIGTLAAGSS
ncbi:MAG: archaetidylserine decarboxylase [Woeseiaceae bacterium]|jgi:phosphatidylserine decarboxylase|nr:archaetidylserine decarboxylase [Woeseiaceae bacterium]